MLHKWLLFLGTILLPIYVHGAYLQGIWNPSYQKAYFVTKFGYQQTNQKYPKDSRGFLFGNFIPQAVYNYSNPVLLALVSSENIHLFRSDSEYGLSCSGMLRNMTLKGFEPRCFPNGTSDVFRWIPCPEGHLCKGEDNPDNVIPGYQMTMQVVEPYNPEHWFVLLLSCNLDANCDWTDSQPNVDISYDIWLTNGRPESPAASFFTFNFSFDEQNTVQIFVITVILYAVLLMILSNAPYKNRLVPQRMRLLKLVVHMELAGYTFQCINVILYAYDGKGIFIFRVAGEILRNVSIQIFCFLLLMLARGWDITYQGSDFNRPVVIFWGILAGLDTVCFFFNFTYVYDVLHDVDVYSSWPGHVMILIRIIYAFWFLLEIRMLIDNEQNRAKAEFLAHFGAGYLVWFISLPMIGIVATFVSQLWRFSLILALRTFSNYVAICVVVHQFWPKSSYRKFFADYTNGHRRLGRDDSHELNDYENLIFMMDESNSDDDYPELDEFSRNEI
ncbi:unnamed protein product [Caenorhabditis bovis]|uniref:GPR180/TMEM145 transmembrane domain-containing protein n=1 Tax=Caenorhabditis bovis TaxID=2654633 RepID=A0A8S1F2S0_9PELO|nr:unnamed protein product [Caenorhabditis bovis]